MAHIAEPRLRIRLILQNSIATPIAMTQTESFEIRPDETFTRHIRFPLDGLAPGEYSIKLSLVGNIANGKSSYFDTVEDVSRFIITEDFAVNAGFAWYERLWGSIRLKPLEMR